MRTISFSEIAYQPKTAVQMKHKTLVPHRISEPFISGVRSGKQGELRTGDPQVCLRVGDGTPGERSSGFGLVEAVHYQRIVGTRAAKGIPSAGIHVAAGSGVDQPVAAAEG